MTAASRPSPESWDQAYWFLLGAKDCAEDLADQIRRLAAMPFALARVIPYAVAPITLIDTPGLLASSRSLALLPALVLADWQAAEVENDFRDAIRSYQQ